MTRKHNATRRRADAKAERRRQKHSVRAKRRRRLHGSWLDGLLQSTVQSRSDRGTR